MMPAAPAVSAVSMVATSPAMAVPAVASPAGVNADVAALKRQDE